MTTSPRERLVVGVWLVVLSLLLVGAIGWVPYLPTNDGPESIFAAHMENHYSDAGTVYRELFAPTLQFAGMGFTVLYGPLEAWLGWQRGLAVALSVIVLAQAWGVVALVREVSPRRLPLAFLGFPLALTWSLYMGFFAFSIASGLGLFVLALGLRFREPRLLERLILSVGLLVTALAHVFAGLLAWGVLGCVSVARAPTGRRLAEAGKVLAVGAPLALLAAAAVAVSMNATGLAGAERFVFRPLGETLGTWPRTLAPGPLPRAVAVAALTVAGVGHAGRVALRRSAPLVDRGLALVGAVFVVATLAGPMTVPGWQCFSQRFVWLGLVALLAVVPLEELSQGRRRVAVTIVALVSAAWLVSSYPFHRRLAASVADAVAALDAPIARHRLLLPVSLEPAGPLPLDPTRHEVPYQAPLAHFGPLFATAQGGLSVYTFASSPATWPFTYREDASALPPVPSMATYFFPMRLPEFQTDPAFRIGLQDGLATFGMRFEGVALTAARPSDVAHWVERGYVPDWAQGSVLLAHFEPCAIEVSVRGTASAPLLDVGVGPITVAQDVHAEDRRRGDPARYLLSDAPCGAVWVRPHWDRGGRTAFCRQALPGGELLVRAGRAGTAVACDSPDD